jgi:hypothetical protein
VAERLLRAGANAVANVCFQKALTYITPATPRHNFEIGDRLIISNVTVSFRCKHASESVNHVPLVSINDISVRGLHFEPIACGPGAAAQYSPIATSAAVIPLIRIEAPFPNVAAEVV